MYTDDQDEPDPKKGLMEKVFLKSCSPIMHTLMKKTVPTGCEGCQNDWCSQTEHTCMGFGFDETDFDRLSKHHYEKAAPLMINKLPKVNINTYTVIYLCDK